MMKLFVLLCVVLSLILYKIVSGERVRSAIRRRYAPMLCAQLGHRRSGRHVRKTGDVYSTRCRVCDVRLEKTAKDGEWHVRTTDARRQDKPPSLEAADVYDTSPSLRRGTKSDLALDGSVLD